MAYQFFGIPDIGQIDLNKLIKQVPGVATWNPLSTQAQYITAILQSYDTLKKYGVDTPMRLAHFLGQGIVETGFFKYKSENLNYSAQGLLKTFPKYFSSLDEANAYARKPEKIANRVYGGRMGNGPEESGDGWRYRGRGFFQLTGKDNYRRYGEMAGVDLVGDPDIISRDLKASILVAAAFFGKSGLGQFADRNDIAAVSRGVNRGDPTSKRAAIGETERIEWTNKALALVKDPNAVLIAPSDGVLRVGASGEAVTEIQRQLVALGYRVGDPAGIFGQNTERAVLAFQHEHNLSPTGAVDSATKAALAGAMRDEPPPAPAPQQPETAPQQPEAKPAPAPEQPQPQPAPAPERKQEAPRRQPPLAQSRTIWGAIVAFFAGLVDFLKQTAHDVVTWIPDHIDTPMGSVKTAYVIGGVLLLALLLIVYARIDDRLKKKR